MAGAIPARTPACARPPPPAPWASAWAGATTTAGGGGGPPPPARGGGGPGGGGRRRRRRGRPPGRAQRLRRAGGGPPDPRRGGAGPGREAAACPRHWPRHPPQPGGHDGRGGDLRGVRRRARVGPARGYYPLAVDELTYRVAVPDSPARVTTGRRVLVLGGGRSGKSRFAEDYLGSARSVTYVATAPDYPGDAEWADRVRQHR